VRRHRLVLGGSVAVSALLLVAWFPVSALVHQRQTLTATALQLEQLRRQDRQLAAEGKRLASAAEVERLARQQYQLVTPGQQAYQVLPPNSQVPADQLYPGDPALQPLAAPGPAAELATGDGAAIGRGNLDGQGAGATTSGATPTSGATTGGATTGGATTGGATTGGATTGAASTGHTGAATSGRGRPGHQSGSASGGSPSGTGSTASGGLMSRIVQTLEFWR
jgi:hypothetical protein